MTQLIKPPDGALVELFFKNGVRVQGYIVKWTEDQILLQDQNSNDHLIINNILENVVVVRVFEEAQEQEPEPENINSYYELPTFTKPSPPVHPSAKTRRRS